MENREIILKGLKGWGMENFRRANPPFIILFLLSFMFVSKVITHIYDHV